MGFFSFLKSAFKPNANAQVQLQGNPIPGITLPPQSAQPAQSVKEVLKKSSKKLLDRFAAVFSGKRKIDADVIGKIEEILISSDLGMTVTQKIIDKISEQYFDKEVEMGDILIFVADEIERILVENGAEKEFSKSISAPFSILVIGINGSGKTTTIAKLANMLKSDGFKGKIVCGDTFRAAATEQLATWGKRLDIETIQSESGDPSGLIFDSMKRARDEKDDYIIIDTAGRLHTHSNLMSELGKIDRVIKKIDGEAPNESIMVIDASVGQNAYMQVEEFQKSLKITGLIVTKLDSTAKGGVVVGLVEKFKLPVYFIGTGEKIDDISEFSAKSFAHNLVGIEN